MLSTNYDSRNIFTLKSAYAHACITTSTELSGQRRTCVGVVLVSAPGTLLLLFQDPWVVLDEIVYHLFESVVCDELLRL